MLPFIHGVYHQYYINYHLLDTSWIEVSTLPYNFYEGSAVVLNNEIHILGGENHYTNHYKYNGTSWIKVSTLPYEFAYSPAIILNNEIHIVGSYSGNYDKYHYKYNGTSWEKVSTLPYSFYDGSAVVLNNEIHILGSSDSDNKTAHYRYNGTSWVMTLGPTNYKEYYLPEGCLIQCNPDNTVVGGNVLYDVNLKAYIVTSTGTVKIKALNDEGHLYNIL